VGIEEPVQLPTHCANSNERYHTLRVIAELSGHRDLAHYSAYLEVRDSQILGAAASLSMLSPMMGRSGKSLDDNTNPNPRSDDAKLCPDGE